MKRLSDIALASDYSHSSSSSSSNTEQQPASCYVDATAIRNTGHWAWLPVELRQVILLDHYLPPVRRLYTMFQVWHLLCSLPLVSRHFRSLVHHLIVPSVCYLSGAILACMPDETTLKRFSSLRGLALCNPTKQNQSDNGGSNLSGDMLVETYNGLLTNLEFLCLEGDACWVRDWQLNGLTKLRELRVDANHTLSPLALDALQNCTTLEKLCLWNAQIRLVPTSMQRAWRSRLTTLSIYRMEQVDLRDFVCLTDLSATRCGLANLTQLGQLRRLSLDTCSVPTTSTLPVALPHLPRLEMLSVTNSRVVVDADLLRGLTPTLRELRLDDTCIPSECLHLCGRSLTSLSLRMRGANQLANAEPWSHWLALTSLRELRLECTGTLIDDATLSRLTRLVSLELQDVSGISDRGLSALTNLRYLFLSSNTAITDAALIGLAPSLRFIDLSRNTGITDDGLSRLTSLTELYVNDNERITDEALAPLVKLRAVSCCRATHISRHCRHRLQEQLHAIVCDERDADWASYSPLDYEWSYMSLEF